MRIGGKDFSFRFGDLLINVERSTLTITDAVAVAKDRGTPNGAVAGEVDASGEIDVDAQAMSLITEMAKKAGAWQLLPLFDLMWFAKTDTGEEMKVEAFGCKFRLDSLVDQDPKGGAKHISKLSFDVTSPDFVHINGVPYLDPKFTEHVISNEQSTF